MSGDVPERPRMPTSPAVGEPETVMEPVPVVDSPPPSRRGRAGRDLPAAVAVGLGLAGLVVASLLVVEVAFVALAGVAIVLAVWELSNALAAQGIRLPVAPVMVGAVAMLVAGYTGGAEPLVVTLVLTGLAALAWRVVDGAQGLLRDVTSALFSATYVPFLAGFAMLMLRAEDGAWWVFVFILLTVCSDVGGYAAGVLFGRHPMAPRVSPKKSWEGFAGSAVTCSGVGAAVVPLVVGGTGWHGALVGLAVAATATLGDLGESMVKRDLGIKDMGSLLPGHGGVMDRLDSLLPTAPVVWALFTYVVPTG